MKASIQQFILQSTGATEFHEQDMIQRLWSGYGSILRLQLVGSRFQTVVVKHVCLPDEGNHPRGWNTDLSHQRKIRSYHVEMAWYRQWADQCDGYCRVPATLGVMQDDQEFIMVLEDLDASAFDQRISNPTIDDINLCIRWLANFHGRFLNCNPEALWPTGTYWHLDTRPDELAALTDPQLKKFASVIDEKLNSRPWQTLVHGDAKLANFCFTRQGDEVAAVDFQYVGGGCGMKDLAYLISSCLNEAECEALEQTLLETYFTELSDALRRLNKNIDFAALELQWRALYPVAWTDFYRFLQGWSPGHWKIHGYSERLAKETIRELS